MLAALVQDGYEEAARILVMREHADAAFKSHLGRFLSARRKDTAAHKASFRLWNIVEALNELLHVRVNGNAPRPETRNAPETWELVRAVQQLQVSARMAKQLGHDGLVFDWIERASRVHHAPLRRQQMIGPEGNVKLHWVDAERIAHVPSTITKRTLAKSSVAGAWNVTESAIKKGRVFRRVSGLGPQMGKELSVMRRDQEVGRVKALDLMHEHVRAFGIGVVSDHSASAQCGALGLVEAVKSRDQLTCLGARRCAHVDDQVLRLNVEQERRNHAYGLHKGNTVSLEVQRSTR
jgi:hypothetical protein